MKKKNIEIVRYPSLMPYIIVGIMYVIGSFVLPMYKIYSYMILIVLMIIIYIVIRKKNVFKDEEVEIEKMVVYETLELKEICELGNEQVETLTHLTKSIQNLQMINDIQGIKETTEAILNFIEENPNLTHKVRKYFKYYLTEIIRLLQQYDEFEDENLQVDNIKVSKEKIEFTVSKANTSFLRFYNDLYEGKVMDVNVDLKVFESMLQKLN